MNKYLKTLRNNAGFTLIELLVVIGILGVLAAALIATIDPFEQLKKAQDANVKNTAVEFVNANIRYYTTHNALPWTDPNVNNCGVNGAGSTNNTPSAVQLSGANGTPCLVALISDSELKSGFTTATAILPYIYFSGNTNGVTACFLPQSKSQQKDANTKYNQAGTLAAPATLCAGQPGGTATTCYWCSL